MATKHKGQRLIVVDGQSYRWYVRHKPSYCQSLGWSPLSFSVRADSGLGQCLYVELDVSRPDSDIHQSNTALTPSLVAHLIRQAQKAGWNPSQPGPIKQIKASINGTITS